VSEQKSLFLVNFLFLFVGGNGGQLFEKTKYGKLIFIDNIWLYVLGTKKENLEALLNNIERQKNNFSAWARASIVVEAKDIDECIKTLLAYVRCGYNYQEEYSKADYSTFIDEKLRGFKPILDIDFENWPIKIERVTVLPNCKSLNNAWKKKGLLICGTVQNKKQISEIDICPIVCASSGLDDGECLPSALIWTDQTRSIRQKIDVHGQKFILETINWRK
jgi:hypothetical protein